MRGLVERSWWNIAVGLLIALLYGWQLLGVLPTDERISWQGHLFGFIGGLIAAIAFRRRDRRGPGRRAIRERLARLRRRDTVEV
jgi:membrane associated rhomboid family serine protease